MKNNKFNSHLPAISLVFAFIVNLFFMYAAYHSSDKIIYKYNPLKHEINKLSNSLSIAHLWLEEVISGDTSIDIEKDVLIPFAHKEFHSYVVSLKNKLETKEDEAYYIKLEDLDEKLHLLYLLLNKRLENYEEHTVGSILDQEFDSKFNNILSFAHSLNSEIDQQLLIELKERKKSFNLIIMIFIALTIMILYMLHLVNKREIKNERKRKETENDLNDQKELADLVFKNTASSVLIIDIEANKFIDCNESAIKILRCNTKEEVLNLHPADISPEFQPDGQTSKAKSDKMNALAVKNGSHAFEWVHLTSKGDEFWVEVVLTLITLREKKVLHVVWRDIGERKALENKLNEQNKTLEKRVIEEVEKNRIKDKKLLEQSETSKKELSELVSSFDKNVIFSKTDLNGIITHVSEAFCEISGYKAEELIGKPHNIVRHPDMKKEVFKDLWDTINLGLPWHGEVKNKRKDGSFYWVFSKIKPDYNSKGEHIGFYAIREDITSKKEVEALSKKLANINLHLEQEVNDRVGELLELDKEIKETQKEVVFTMGAIGETRSKETGNHVKRVAEYSKLLALYYGLSEEEADMLKQASPMHDIGKVGIPDAILNKPGRFDEDERIIMNTHSQLGFDMLKHSKRPLLKMAATVAYEHHEKWDGSGYPNALKGEDIHIYGRITAVADVFDALGSDRVYKKAWELEKILTFFKEEREKHFDPTLIDIFFDNLDEFLKIRDKFKD